jgi:hypothetical protein
MGQRLTEWKQVVIGTNQASQTITNEVRVSDFMGVREQAIHDDLSGNFIGTFSSAPADLTYWVVNITPDNGGVTSSITSLSVVLEQEIEFFAETAAQQPEALLLPPAHRDLLLEATKPKVTPGTPCTCGAPSKGC